jgi:outer membrane protein OmpA-like peptidoglycan-associated protein
MAERHSDNDGSDIFWPGYVDAVTNLVLNLLFLLTIMTVAVFMFALELGRASQAGASKKQVGSTQKHAETVLDATHDPYKENIELKREIQRLNMKLAQQIPRNVDAGGLVKTVDATSKVPKPLNGLEKTLAVSDSEILVRFSDDAISLTPLEHDRLRESLKPIVASGKTTIYVEVPAGFSEAKRMGFYRAMAVRNLLIEMKMPKNNISVSVREGKSSANASLVRVRSH